jgi:FtsH-binding integral membrane protein
MIEPQTPYPQAGTRPAPELASSLLTQSFGWMFAGLLLTSVIAYFVSTNKQVISTVGDAWFLIFFGQLGLAIGIQGLIRRINATVALGLFFVFAATMGFTVGVIVSFYTVPSVITSFFSASAMFGAAAIYGYTTKRSLTGIGGFLFMGVIGLIVASIVNVFLNSGPLGWIIAAIGVIIFTVLTAYDVQRMKSGDYIAMAGSVEKASVVGALHLYINFVNIFLFLLRLFGSRD